MRNQNNIKQPPNGGFLSPNQGPSACSRGSRPPYTQPVQSKNVLPRLTIHQTRHGSPYPSSLECCPYTPWLHHWLKWVKNLPERIPCPKREGKTLVITVQQLLQNIQQLKHTVAIHTSVYTDKIKSIVLSPDARTNQPIRRFLNNTSTCFMIFFFENQRVGNLESSVRYPNTFHLKGVTDYKDTFHI